MVFIQLYLYCNEKMTSRTDNKLIAAAFVVVKAHQTFSIKYKFYIYSCYTLNAARFTRIIDSPQIQKHFLQLLKIEKKNLTHLRMNNNYKNDF